MRNRFLTNCMLGVGFIGVFMLIASSGWSDTSPEQLIVFIQPEGSAVDAHFQKHQLPKIRMIAEEMGIDIYVIDAEKGTPPEISITPLIVYQNHRGRSIYQGRTTTSGRIRNFIRTSRYVPQGKEANRREDIPIWKNGRMRVWAPLKVAAVTGLKPKDYNNDIFVTDAIKNIKKGFKKFRFQKTAELGRADRGFYMDFYPWLSKDGTLYLSLALFSQFHCKAPVYTEKIIAPWSKRQKLFKEAAALMEAAVLRQIKDTESGDAFDPIMPDVVRLSWNKLGFPLPPAPEMKRSSIRSNIKIPKNWVLAKSGPNDPPMIQFRFPAPLDHYAGEVKAGIGEFTLPANLRVEGSKGFIAVDTRSAVTMGDPVLDEAIQGSMLLSSKKFPSSKFIVETISGDGHPIAFGRLTPAMITGIFTLKGKRVSISAKSEFEPIIGETGNPQLLSRTAFKIDLRTFNIEGADGPAPAKYMLFFDINLTFDPAGKRSS